MLGRGEVSPGERRLVFVRQRPGHNDERPPLAGRRISRRQLSLSATQSSLTVTVTGRCRTLVNGVPMQGSTTVDVGDTILLHGELLLGCVRRRPTLASPPRQSGVGEHAFGTAGAHGIVGESEAAWRLRQRIRFVGPSSAHVLITGQSGVGKELVARAVHHASTRSHGPWVARNAATLPSSLIDAELFGHAANYPNAGVPERHGLIGEAHRGTLFLDEIGELSGELQAHLLRVLDSGGEHQRLGDPTVRHADFRLVAATNKGADELKHDVLARLKLRIDIPGLNERPEDIPLLLAHLVRRAAAEDHRIAEQFVKGDGTPRVHPRLVDALVRHHYTLHVRELDSLLWLAFSGSEGTEVELTDELRAQLSTQKPSSDPSELSREQIEAALITCGGNQQRAYRLLNLKNRDLLYRLLKKHDIDAKQFQR